MVYTPWRARFQLLISPRHSSQQGKQSSPFVGHRRKPGTLRRLPGGAGGNPAADWNSAFAEFSSPSVARKAMPTGWQSDWWQSVQPGDSPPWQPTAPRLAQKSFSTTSGVRRFISTLLPQSRQEGVAATGSKLPNESGLLSKTALSTALLPLASRQQQIRAGTGQRGTGPIADGLMEIGSSLVIWAAGLRGADFNRRWIPGLKGSATILGELVSRAMHAGANGPPRASSAAYLFEGEQ
jgi:hypothetical protein